MNSQLILKNPSPTLLTKLPSSILNLLYRHRYLTRRQLQSFLGHSHPSRINACLSSLRSQRLITAVKLPAGTIRHNPPIYFLSNPGIQYVKTRSDIDPQKARRLYAASWATPAFVEKCLFLADLCLQLNDLTNTEFKNYSTFMDHAIGPNLPTQPDLVIQDEYSKRYFLLFVPPATLPPYHLTTSIISLLESSSAASTVLIVTQSTRHIPAIRKAIRRCQPPDTATKITVKTISRNRLSKSNLFDSRWNVLT